jgi:hypothetical protein
MSITEFNDALRERGISVRIIRLGLQMTDGTYLVQTDDNLAHDLGNGYNNIFIPWMSALKWLC